MAWIDDRIWCHPKFTPLSAAAFAAYIKGVAYSAGMGTGGRLDLSQQSLIKASSKTRLELVRAGLWDSEEQTRTIRIHDWDEHNGKRDERRRKDRDRKRRARRADQALPGDSPQDVARTSAGTSTGTAHVDGSEGSEEKNPTHQPELKDVAGGSENGQSEQDLTPIGEDVAAVLNSLQGTTA